MKNVYMNLFHLHFGQHESTCLAHTTAACYMLAFLRLTLQNSMSSWMRYDAYSKNKWQQ